MTFPHSQQRWTEITLLQFTDSQGKKERMFYYKQFKSSRVTFSYLDIRSQECTTKTFSHVRVFLRSSHITIYICTEFISALPYNLILLLCGVALLLLLCEYVNLLWVYITYSHKSKRWEWIFPPPHTKTNLQKCNKASENCKTNTRTYTYMHIHTILYKSLFWSGIETTTAPQRHMNKTLHILTHQKNIRA